MVPSMQAGREVALFDPAELATIKTMSPLGNPFCHSESSSHVLAYNVIPHDLKNICLTSNYQILSRFLDR